MAMSPQEIRQAVSSGKTLIDSIKDLAKSNKDLTDAIKHSNALTIEHGRILQKLVDKPDCICFGLRRKDCPVHMHLP